MLLLKIIAGVLSWFFGATIFEKILDAIQGNPPQIILNKSSKK